MLAHQGLLDRSQRPLAPALVRFLPTWDATLLVHARRARILPEEHRPRIFHVRNPHSSPTFLVDVAVVGTWRHRSGAIELEPLAPLDAATRRRCASCAPRPSGSRHSTPEESCRHGEDDRTGPL